jgi:hypothetical protein
LVSTLESGIEKIADFAGAIGRQSPDEENAVVRGELVDLRGRQQGTPEFLLAFGAIRKKEA